LPFIKKHIFHGLIEYDVGIKLDASINKFIFNLSLATILDKENINFPKVYHDFLTIIGKVIVP
jgi:hypothetical protein